MQGANGLPPVCRPCRRQVYSKRSVIHAGTKKRMPRVVSVESTARLGVIARMLQQCAPIVFTTVRQHMHAQIAGPRYQVKGRLDAVLV